MVCANCGNSDPKWLHGEGDTIYCKRCAMRTRTGDGKLDVVRCPYCHRMRDRKGFYCKFCNDTARQPSTPEEFKEIDDLLKELGY